MGMCKGAFPPRIPRKQRRPSALQTMNCTPADYRLQKSMGQTTMSANNSVVFHLIMVQRSGEKWAWITFGSHTSIGIHWHPFGVLEADDYCQNNRL
jgi:hypothetical protein